MKLAAFRFSFVAALFAVSSFLVVGISANSSANQQRPDKPKLQKSQQPREDEAQQKDDSPIRIGTDLVLLDVTVVDPSNKPVMDLKQGDFAVTEDKAPQTIAFFSREQVPVSLVFAIDTSGSMRPKIDTVVKASTN